jgi:hypothetical protein
VFCSPHQTTSKVSERSLLVEHGLLDDDVKQDTEREREDALMLQTAAES